MGLHPTGHSVSNVTVRKTFTGTARAISTLYINSCKYLSNITNSQFHHVIIIIIIYSLDAGLLARVSIRKVLRLATSAQVFLGFPVSRSEC